MTGKLVCPIGPDTKLEANPTGQEVEVWGVCVAHLETDFRLSKLEVRFLTLHHGLQVQRCSSFHTYTKHTFLVRLCQLLELSAS